MYRGQAALRLGLGLGTLSTSSPTTATISTLWLPLPPFIVHYPLPPPPPQPQLPPPQLSYPTLPFHTTATLVWKNNNSSPLSSAVQSMTINLPTTPLSPSVEAISLKSSPDSTQAGGMVSSEMRGAGFPQIMSTSSQTKKRTSVSLPWNYSTNSSHSRRIYNSSPPIRWLPTAQPPS